MISFLPFFPRVEERGQSVIDIQPPKVVATVVLCCSLEDTNDEESLSDFHAGLPHYSHEPTSLKQF